MAHLVRLARGFRTVTGLCNKSALFQQAVDESKKLSASPSNSTLLSLYALFKQATVGDCTEPSPSAFQLKERAKWEAWTKLKGTTQETAKSSYVDLVVSLGAKVGGIEKKPESVVEPPVILTDLKDNVFTITMNRPKRYNAFSTELLRELCTALVAAGKSDAKVAVITGAGSYYSSGNDISNFITAEPPSVAAAKASKLVQELVGAFIDFPLPLVAAVNGPAIGIGVTSLGLCDFVYASDKATFSTPFTALGLCPEGCSSYTFPNIVGSIRANEILVAGKKWTAHEALQYGLLTAVYEDALFAKSVQQRVSELVALPKHSLRVGKTVMRHSFKQAMHATNAIECAAIEQQWQGSDCQNAVAAFLKRK